MLWTADEEWQCLGYMVAPLIGFLHRTPKSFTSNSCACLLQVLVEVSFDVGYSSWFGLAYWHLLHRP